jgi:anti-sigma B factor antagonist
VLESTGFALTVHPGRACVQVAAQGEIDLTTAPRLRAQIQELLQAGCADVVADLREVSFMDSTGVHVLLDAHLMAQDLGARFSIVEDHGPVARVLRLTSFDRALTFAPAERSSSASRNGQAGPVRPD